MKKTALASLLAGVVMTVGLVAPSVAQEAKKDQAKVDPHLAAAMEVVEQTGNLPPFEDQFKLIVINAKNWLIRQNPSLENEINQAVEASAEKYKDRTDAISRAAAIAWTRYLKENELKEVLAFFKTDVGQKFANYNPRILGESIKSIQDYSGLMTQAIVEQAKEQLNKKGHKFK